MHLQADRSVHQPRMPRTRDLRTCEDSMIVAHMMGGPRDGETLTVDGLDPLVCASPLKPLGAATESDSEEPPLTTTYLPRPDSYRACTCRPDCPHGEVVYHPAGWGS